MEIMAHHDSNTDLRIVILVDNPATDGLLAEHGFSLWIETSGQRILFDTGQAGLSGPIPRITAYEDTGGLFYFDPAGRRLDPIEFSP
jgi:hypothetical protein